MENLELITLHDLEMMMVANIEPGNNDDGGCVLFHSHSIVRWWWWWWWWWCCWWWWWWCWWWWPILSLILSNRRNKDRLFGDASIYLPLPPRPCTIGLFNSIQFGTQSQAYFCNLCWNVKTNMLLYFCLLWNHWYFMFSSCNKINGFETSLLTKP